MTEIPMGGIGVLQPGPTAPLPRGHASFDEWAAPHLMALRALALREVGAAEAEDVVQNTLLRAWQRRSTYDPQRGSARAWLVAILLDRCRRHRVREARADLSPTGEEIADVASRQTAADGRLDIEAAVRLLPRRQRQVVVLHYLADLKVADVAAVLRITEGAAKAHLSDARARLRDILGERHA